MFLLHFQTHTTLFLSLHSLTGRRGGNSLKINDKIGTSSFILHMTLTLPFVKHTVMCYNLVDTFVNIFICLSVSVYLTEIISRSLFVNIIYSHSPLKTVGWPDLDVDLSVASLLFEKSLLSGIILSISRRVLVGYVSHAKINNPLLFDCKSHLKEPNCSLDFPSGFHEQNLHSV